MIIGYIVHNLNDPAVERRCEMLERGGARVKLAGFRRDAALSEPVRLRGPLELGASTDAAMVQRALVTVKNVVFHSELARFFHDCDVIIARNLEQLAIAVVIAAPRPLIYECLDLHRSLTGSSPGAKVVQLVEDRLLQRVDLLLTSSPAFSRHHFDTTSLEAPTYLIENKLLVAEESMPQRFQLEAQSPLVIGWFGMLRCAKTLAFLSDIVSRSEGRVIALICGKPSPAELPDFRERVAAVPGLTFTGAYTYDELPELYGQCHFAWAIDWFEEGQNSAWLLPNRIYEAIAHGAIPIALADVEVGRWLARNNAGLRVANGEEAAERLLAMTMAKVREMQTEIAHVPAEAVVADTRDCHELVKAIMQTRKP